MKYLLLLTIFLASCSPVEVTSDKIVYRDEVAYLVNTQKPFTGNVVDYHDNGQLQYSFSFKDGKVDGTPKEYSKNGRLLSTGAYKNGE